MRQSVSYFPWEPAKEELRRKTKPSRRNKKTLRRKKKPVGGKRNQLRRKIKPLRRKLKPGTVKGTKKNLKEENKKH